jgi:hypothetical protein
MLQSFVKMIRERTTESIERFYYWVRRVYDTCREDHRASIAPLILSQRFILEILEANPPRSIDPAVHSFVVQCGIWGDQRLNGEFNVIHDRSKPLYAERDTLALFMNPTISPVTIGYDRRKFTFPLRVRRLDFGDSHEFPQLQVADLIAGSVMAWAANHASGLYPELAIHLEAAGIKRLVSEALWPSTAVTPEQLGTEEVGGINAVDYLANHFAGLQG